MRIVSSLLALCLAMPAVYGEATGIIEEMEPHDVELGSVITKPTAFLGMRIRFQATFVQTADLFDTFHTGFTPGRFLNLVLWDDEADIWVPEVRSEPLMSVFYEKRREGANAISTLDKYTLVEIIGEVVSDFRGQPWINCHSVIPLDQLGRLSENGVYHIQRANDLAGKGSYDLANEHYTKALAESVPNFTRVTLLQLKAENLLSAGEFETASMVLEEALAGVDDNISSDRHARLHYLRAKALGEQAQQVMTADETADVSPWYQSAVEHAREAVDLNPDLGDAYAVLGISLAGLEEFVEAKRQCQRAIIMLPENAEVRWYLGRILNLEAAYSEAVDVLRDAIDLAPKDYRLHKTIAVSYFERGKLGGNDASEDVVNALREDDIAIRLEPNDPDLHFHSGLVIEHATERGQQIRLGLKMTAASFELAIERFEACVAVDETYTEAHVRLGHRYRHAGNDNKAVEHFARALELEPERAELYALLGNYLWDLNRREEAYEVYAKHNVIAPDHLDTLYALGRLSLELDEDARGVTWMDKLIALESKHAMAHADLTEMQTEVGAFKDALVHASLALELLGDDQPDEQVRTHRFAGISAWALDDVEKTIAHLQEHGGGSDDIRVLLAAGWALTTTDDLSNALTIATKAQAMAGDRAAEAAELLGWVQYLQGNYTGAEATLGSLLEAGAESNRLAYRLGMTLFQQGSARYAEAKPLLNEARGLSTRQSILANARREASAALSTIDDWEDDQARAAREEAKRQAAAQKAAQRAAEEARRAAERAQQQQ